MGSTKVSLTKRKKYITNVVAEYGGPLAFLSTVQDKLNDKTIRYQRVINWRERGNIPLSIAIQLANKLDLDVKFLNKDGHRV